MLELWCRVFRSNAMNRDGRWSGSAVIRHHDAAQLQSARGNGFTIIELVILVVILGVLLAIAYPRFVNLSKDAEAAASEATIGALASALNIYSVKQLAAGQPLVAHNPFDDLARPPGNYAGAFPDVDLSNCPPGQWAYQSGNASNGNWAVVLYRAKATLTTAFAWGGAQWLIYEVKTNTNAAGQTVGLTLTEYPPLHKW
jgi:prepilin-type N-terminal cleavage/methylation domain-containing protein